jgi:hypothetical protein
MMGIIHQALCDHGRKYLAVKTIDYNTEYIPCTKIDHEVFCTLCGKVILGRDQFDSVKELLETVQSRTIRF